jgi:Glycosyl hydrolase family 63 C-terminal domain
VNDALQSGFRLMEDERSKQRHISFAGALLDKKDAAQQPNLVFHQVTGKLPFELGVVYESQSVMSRGHELRGEVYDSLLHEHHMAFFQNLESKFHLFEKDFSEDEISFGKAALINLICIGYFYGSSKVQSFYNK